VITRRRVSASSCLQARGCSIHDNDVLAAIDAIESDYEGNCRAGEIAAEYFAAEKVIGSLMEKGL